MLNRTIAPPFVEAKSFDLPSARKQKLSNGIDLFTLPHVQQDVLKIELVFNAAKWQETQMGVSHFTAQMLEKGTPTKTAQQISEAFDGWGAHIEISPGYDFTAVSLYSLAKNWNEAFRLLTELIQVPTFPAEELELQKTIFLQNLKVNLEKNSFVAGQVIRKNLFGSAHPYGSSILEENVKPLDRQHLAEFHKKYYQPFAVFVTAGSSFDEQSLIRLLEQFPKVVASAPRSFTLTAGVQKDHIEKAESIQTAIRVGKKSLGRKHPDYLTLLLLNHIFGGYFGSRLMKNIREEKGLTYGIYSSLQALRHESFWVIGADVNKENKDLALDEIRKELDAIRQQPISADELDIARSHFLGSLQSEVANPFSVMEKAKNIYLNELPADFYQHLFSQMKKTTAEDLMRVANTHLNEKSLKVVTVG